MLRRHLTAAKPGGEKVIPVDNGQSAYRALWIGDMITVDGIKWLREERKGGVGDVLLLVYLIVGGGGFTERIIKAYKGEVVCVVGTQCRNEYTAFQGKIVDEWIEEEGGWDKIVQVPAPSFAGQDKASTCINMKAAAHKRQQTSFAKVDHVHQLCQALVSRLVWVKQLGHTFRGPGFASH